jgi:TPR repeat protein
MIGANLLFVPYRGAGPALQDMLAGQVDLMDAMRFAEQGNVAAQFNLARMYTKGLGVPQDDAAAMSWYRKAADQGVAEAEFTLGLLYLIGRGATRDYAAAADWIQNRPGRYRAAMRRRGA